MAPRGASSYAGPMRLLVACALVVSSCLLGPVPAWAVVAGPTVGGSVTGTVGASLGTCGARKVATGVQHPVDRQGSFTDAAGRSWTFSVRGCAVTIPRTGGLRIRARITAQSALGTLEGAGTGGATFFGDVLGGMVEYYAFRVHGSDGLAEVRAGRAALQLSVPFGSAHYTGSASAMLRGCTVCS